MSKNLNPRQQYRKEHKKLWEEMETHLDKLIHLRESIQPNDKILLVGPNASGKSLFRSLLAKAPFLAKKKCRMVHASMALRTGNHASLGGLSSMFSDHGDDATSNASIKLLEGAIRNCGNWLTEGHCCGLHIDEPEVGCSEEIQMGMGPWLRTKLDELNPLPIVTLVTTHSRHIATHFKTWKLIDTGFQYKTPEEWINRDIQPIDPEAIAIKARTLFLVIVERMEQNKSKK